MSSYKVEVKFEHYYKNNGKEKCVGKTLVCDTTSKTGVFDYIDILGICRTKAGKDITTFHQAKVCLLVESEGELSDLIDKYGKLESIKKN